VAHTTRDKAKLIRLSAGSKDRWNRLSVRTLINAHPNPATKEVQEGAEKLSNRLKSALPGGAPGRVRAAHQTDQLAYVFRNRRMPVLAMPDFHIQKRRKPFQCQAITVSGLTTMSTERHSAQTPHSQAQRSRSRGVNLGFFTERCRTPSWCRSARSSNWRAARVLKTDDRATTSAVSIPSVRAQR
jgi:hypothetical protein